MLKMFICEDCGAQYILQKPNSNSGRCRQCQKKRYSEIRKLNHFNGEPSYRKEALEAAYGLNYGRDVIQKIQLAKNDAEIERIMVTARHKSMEQYRETCYG